VWITRRHHRPDIDRTGRRPSTYLHTYIFEGRDLRTKNWRMKKQVAFIHRSACHFPFLKLVGKRIPDSEQMPLTWRTQTPISMTKIDSLRAALHLRSGAWDANVHQQSFWSVSNTACLKPKREIHVTFYRDLVSRKPHLTKTLISSERSKFSR
jgi:hypothetical protein